VGIENRRRKKSQQPDDKSSILLSQEKKNAAFINPIPSVKTPTKPTDRHLIPEGNIEPAKPRLRKDAPVFKKRPGHTARSTRKQSTTSILDNHDMFKGHGWYG
jgi:hypothetical protein